MDDTAEDRHRWLSELDNESVAHHLDEVAQLLENQGANLFRVAAYRKAAKTLRGLDCPIRNIFDAEGRAGLVRLEEIGQSIAHSIEQILRTGKMPLLERLKGESAPARIFTTVPDIGPKIARRIHEELGIESLAELQAAAWDGWLACPGWARSGFRRSENHWQADHGGKIGRMAVDCSKRRRHPMWLPNYSTLIARTAVWPNWTGSHGSLRVGSIQKGKHGCRFFIHNAETDTTRPCFPIPPAPTKWGPLAIGSASIATTMPITSSGP